MDDRRDLCAGRLCLRHKVAAGAVDQTLADRPVHRLNGVGGELRRVGKAAEIFLERHSRHAAVDCVAVQDRRKLLTGHGVVRAEEAGAVAVDDAVRCRPCDRLGEPLVAVHILEVGCTGHGGAARHAVEDGDDHGTGQRCVGREAIGARAVHDALLVDVADIVIEPVAAGHIGKREPYRGSGPGRGDRGAGGDGRRRQDSLMPTCIEGLVAGLRRLDLLDLHAAGVGGEPAEEGIAGLGHIGRENGHSALGVGRRVFTVDRAAIGDVGDAPRLDRRLACGADDVRAVADTDTRVDRRAVQEDEGIVIGGKANRLDLIADDGVLDFLVLRDVAVDEDACFVAGRIPDHDGLDLAFGLFHSGDRALDLDEAAEDGAVVDLRGGDFLGSRSRCVGDLFDLRHSQLTLALIGGRRTGDTDLIADLKVACNREGVDTGGVVLHIDAVEERGILVIAGGVGGHDALHGELDALLCLCLHIRDPGDLGLVEHGDEILADLVVGVVLLRAAVGDLVLHLEVRHEGCAGDDNEALALELLRCHDHQAVIVFCEGVLRGSCAAEAVAVNVHRVGRCMAVDCRADRCGQRGGCIAACVNCVDGRAAVVAEAFGVELVKRMLFVEFHALQKRVLHVVGREVQSPLVNAVGCGANIVIRCVVRNAEARAELGQNLVLRRGHVLDVRVALDDGVILVVVGPAGEDHHAAVVVKRLEGVQLFCGIGLRILLGRFQTAGRSRQDDGLVLGIAAGRDELLAGLQRDCTHGIGRSQFAEVAHGVLIVACNVFVVVRGVNADVDKLACVKHIERDVLGERVLLAVLLDHSRDPDGHDAGLGRGILEFHILRAACSQRDGIRHGADGFAADGIGDGLDGSGLCLTVEERGGDGQFFVGDRGRRAPFTYLKILVS